MLLLALAAAQLRAPEPKDNWFERVLPPVQELSQQMLFKVLLRVTVTPDGKLQSCEVEQSSGTLWMDEYACEVTRKKARFRPAHLADGTPAYGVFRVPVVWTAIPPHWYDRKPTELRPKGDLDLTAARLPKGRAGPLPIDLVFTVDAAGHLSNCAAEDKNQDLGLVSLACEQMTARFAAVPAKGLGGQPVLSVQNGRVIFNKR